ncbi:hypothetical protein CPB85DRAFT_155825 [Mucidula mucida]|nr:hypothetical protein CPB85DRAFT_155825 [Mucidula mucida]
MVTEMQANHPRPYSSHSSSTTSSIHGEPQLKVASNSTTTPISLSIRAELTAPSSQVCVVTTGLLQAARGPDVVLYSKAIGVVWRIGCRIALKEISAGRYASSERELIPGRRLWLPLNASLFSSRLRPSGLLYARRPLLHATTIASAVKSISVSSVHTAAQSEPNVVISRTQLVIPFSTQ